eukprot:GHUV01010181.1.p1 GENE.GHUV01010181.1~~GHUV01010181.1.p1  ORF type:complete len:200 (+),score=32.30 GHUV01010181.1:101-700(+)
MFRSLTPLCQCLLQTNLGLAPAAASSPCIHSLLERQQTHFSTSNSSQAQGARNAPLADPWTPTSQLIKRKTYQKRSRFLIQMLENEQVQRLADGKELPEFTAGDILEVTTVVPEADRRVYTYKGVCVAKANKGPRSWFKIYNVFPDVGGFVQHFPLYMPDLLSIKVVGRVPKAKRSKLYHISQDEGPKHIYQTSIPPPK